MIPPCEGFDSFMFSLPFLNGTMHVKNANICLHLNMFVSKALKGFLIYFGFTVHMYCTVRDATGLIIQEYFPYSSSCHTAFLKLIESVASLLMVHKFESPSPRKCMCIYVHVLISKCFSKVFLKSHNVYTFLFEFSMN